MQREKIDVNECAINESFGFRYKLKHCGTLQFQTSKALIHKYIRKNS